MAERDLKHLFLAHYTAPPRRPELVFADMAAAMLSPMVRELARLFSSVCRVEAGMLSFSRFPSFNGLSVNVIRRAVRVVTDGPSTQDTSGDIVVKS
jgi:hypothetical protein